MSGPGTPLPWVWLGGTAIVRNGKYIHVDNARPRRAACANAAFIVRACNNHDALLEALEEMYQAMEYWAGCDEGCSADTASSEIMSSGGAWPSVAYANARAAIAAATDAGS